MNRLFRITLSEIRSSFTLPRIFGLLIAAIVPLITPIAVGNVSTDGGLQNNTMHMLGRVFSEGVMYALGIRIALLLNDKSTLDKNRASYLSFSKGQVLFAKVFADAALFFISIVFLTVAGPMVVILKNHGEVASSFYGHATIFALGMLFFYVMVSIGMRYISASIKNGSKKGIILGVFMTVTIGVYVTMSILVGVVDSVGNFYTKHVTIMAIVPLVNITSPIRVLYGQDAMWTVVPLIVQSLVVVGVLWKPLSTNLKEYLCG